MNNYQDTFIWGVLTSTHADTAELIDSLAYKHVRKTERGLKMEIYPKTYLLVEIDAVTGVKLQISDTSGTRNIEYLDLVEVVTKLNLVKIEQQHDKVIVDNVISVIIDSGFVYDIDYISNCELAFKFVVTVQKTTIELGYDSDASYFHVFRFIEIPSTELETSSQLKQICADLLSSYILDIQKDIKSILT